MQIAENRSRLLVAILLMALLFLSACNGDDNDSASDDVTATPTEDSGNDNEAPTDGETPSEDGGDDGDAEAPEDVCTLLTTEEVSAATQADMQDGVPDNSPPFFGCDWEDELGLNTATIEILTGNDDSNRSYFDATGDAEAIDGLGERAQYTDLIGLEVLTDHYVVGIRMFAFDLDDDVARTATLALGELVIERLGD